MAKSVKSVARHDGDKVYNKTVSRSSPVYLFAMIVITVFTAEWLIMLGLLAFPDIPHEWEALLDASLLTFLIFPVLYFFYYRPKMKDIEALRETSAKLEQSRHRIRAVADAMTDAVLQIDRDGSISYCNLTAEKLFGYEVGKVVGLNIHNLLGVGDSFELIDSMLIKLQTASTNKQVKELFARKKSGQGFPVELALSQVQDDDEMRAVAVVRDITDRKKSQLALRESEKRFRESLENVSLYTMQVENNCKIIFINDYMLKITGLERREALGYDWVELFIPEPDRKRIRIEFANNLFSEKKIESAEYEILARDGMRCVASFNKTRLRDTLGSVIGFTIIGEDITDRKNAEIALQESNIQLSETLDKLKKTQSHLIRSEKMASLGQLAAGVAHEIRNPLNIISTSIQLLTLERELTPEIRKSTSLIIEQVKRAAKITDNLREFAREKKPEMRDMNLHDFLDKSLSLVEYEMSLENINIRKAYYNEPIYLLGDEDQLAQVFLNIIGNARDSMNEKQTKYSYDELQNIGWEGRLTLETSVEDNMACVRFGDTGLGIAQGAKAKLFDPFYTTKPEGKGTGLGLAIAYGIIESHGGKIELKSDFGDFAEFSIYIPKSPNF